MQVDTHELVTTVFTTLAYEFHIVFIIQVECCHQWSLFSYVDNYVYEFRNVQILFVNHPGSLKCCNFICEIEKARKLWMGVLNVINSIEP